MANSSKNTGQAIPLATPLLKNRVRGIGLNALLHARQPKEVAKLANMAQSVEKRGTIDGRLSTGCGQHGQVGWKERQI
jgi:hypothetical protein